MSRLSRHIGAELLQVFLVTLLVLVAFMTLMGIAQETIRQGIPPATAVRLLPYALANALCYALPGAALLSVCAVYGRMSAANEIVALKSLGISPTTVIGPALVLSFLLSLTTVWLIDIAFSWGYRGMQRVALEAAEEIAYGVLRARRAYRTSHFSINVARVDGDRLLRPTITVQGTRNRAPMLITAREARLRTDPERHGVTLLLTDGSLDAGNNVSMRFPDTIEQTLPLVDIDDGHGRFANPSHMRLRDIAGAVIRQNEVIQRLGRALAVDAAAQMICGDFDRLTDEDAWAARYRQIGYERQRLNRLGVEPPRRWASGFSCLCFALVGVPLSIRLRRADFVTTFGLCFLPILLVYYPLFAFGLDRAKLGVLPPYSVWLGNAVCCGVGAWQFRKVLRY